MKKSHHEHDWKEVPRPRSGLRDLVNTHAAPVCKCSHVEGEHYSKKGWPACGECTECQEYEAEQETP